MPNNMFNKKQILVTLGVCLLLIMLIGIIFNSSITQPISEYRNEYKLAIFKSHMKFLLVGLATIGGTFLILSKIEEPKTYCFTVIVVYFIMILLLVLTLFVGRTVNGAKRWLWFIQPSEFVKPTIIYTLAFTMTILEYSSFKNYKWIKFGTWAFISAIPVLLVIAQKSNTSALLIGALCYLMLCVSPIIKEKYKLLIGFLGVFAGLIVILKRGYATKRITSFLGDSKEIQVKAALEAVKTGGIFGRGIGNGYQKYFYLPEAHNDYIFASICEEGGLIFALLIVALFAIFFVTCIYVASKVRNKLYKYIIYGVAFSIVNQAILNICINLSITPSTGVTLPFISYGGSSFLANSISIGLLFSAIAKSDDI